MARSFKLDYGVESASYCPAKAKFAAGGGNLWVYLHDASSGEELECNKGVEYVLCFCGCSWCTESGHYRSSHLVLQGIMGQSTVCALHLTATHMHLGQKTGPYVYGTPTLQPDRLPMGPWPMASKVAHEDHNLQTPH